MLCGTLKAQKKEGAPLMENRIRELRTERGLTLKELSLAVSVPMSTLRQYETDERRKIPAEIIERLASYFNVSQKYVLGAWSPKEVIGLIKDTYIQNLNVVKKQFDVRERRADKNITLVNLDRGDETLYAIMGTAYNAHSIEEKLAFAIYDHFESLNNREANRFAKVSYFAMKDMFNKKALDRLSMWESSFSFVIENDLIKELMTKRFDKSAIIQAVFLILVDSTNYYNFIDKYNKLEKDLSELQKENERLKAELASKR